MSHGGGLTRDDVVVPVIAKGIVAATDDFSLAAWLGLRAPATRTIATPTAAAKAPNRVHEHRHEALHHGHPHAPDLHHRYENGRRRASAPARQYR